MGPNAKWWNNYYSFADACRRLSWLNTDSHQVCEIAILGEANWLPDKSAKVCYQNQLDFNYLELSHLAGEAITDAEGVHIGGMTYKTVVLDGLNHLPENVKPALQKLEKSGRLIICEDSPFAFEFP